jgi:hypothetical protein
MSLTLPPPEKILPIPVRITARMAASALASSTAASKAATKPVSVIALPR